MIETDPLGIRINLGHTQILTLVESQADELCCNLSPGLHRRLLALLWMPSLNLLKRNLQDDLRD